MLRRRGEQLGMPIALGHRRVEPAPGEVKLPLRQQLLAGLDPGHQRLRVAGRRFDFRRLAREIGPGSQKADQQESCAADAHRQGHPPGAHPRTAAAARPAALARRPAGSAAGQTPPGRSSRMARPDAGAAGAAQNLDRRRTPPHTTRCLLSVGPASRAGEWAASPTRRSARPAYRGGPRLRSRRPPGGSRGTSLT